jgi:hypothetical protein
LPFFVIKECHGRFTSPGQQIIDEDSLDQIRKHCRLRDSNFWRGGRNSADIADASADKSLSGSDPDTPRKKDRKFAARSNKRHWPAFCSIDDKNFDTYISRNADTRLFGSFGRIA